MALSGKGGSPYFKWYFILIYLAALAVALLTVFTDVFRTDQPGQIPQMTWLLGGVLLLFAVVIILARIIRLGQLIEDNTAKMDQLVQAQEKNSAELAQITQYLHLSESAKSFICRDDDSRAIRETVFNKLQNKDFEGAYALIDELSATSQYAKLARQLRGEADKFQDSGESERENQLIANIDEMLEQQQWAKASVQIENLIKAFPNSERAKQMRQKLVDKKEQRKKVLLNLWDDAVKRQATDRSLEILRELDMYLTPNEALALQEAARDVFRSKLHNIGVQFSLAVSGRQWEKALEAGEQIIREFPNSKMAQEIRERMDVLRERVRERAKEAK